MTFSYNAFLPIVESCKTINPEDKYNIIKVVEMNDDVIFIYENTLVENGKITEHTRTYDVIKMEGNKFKSVVAYNSHDPDFKSLDKWLNSLNLEYERQSI
jgi:hypothetical protein